MIYSAAFVTISLSCLSNASSICEIENLSAVKEVFSFADVKSVCPTVKGVPNSNLIGLFSLIVISPLMFIGIILFASSAKNSIALSVLSAVSVCIG